MKRIRIFNKFGIDANSSAADKEPLPYKVETGTDGATYVCFFETGDAPRAIHKITDSALTVAYGKWSNKESLSYAEPNKDFVIEETI
jgi:hypothetical protein